MTTITALRPPCCAALITSLAAGCAATLLLSGAGCAAPEPSPRSVSYLRANVIAEQIEPAVAVLQGEGGPVEILVRNAGQVPVRAFDIDADAATDDGAPVEKEAKGHWPELAPGETAKATVVVRPIEAGDSVVHRFRVTFVDARVKKSIDETVGKDGSAGGAATPILRSRSVDVKVQAQASEASVGDARVKAKVGPEAPGIHSGTLGAWAFATTDGVVLAPADGDAVAWPGVSLRAVAWVDMLAGDRIPIRFESDGVRERTASGVALQDDAERGRGEATIEETAVATLFDHASKSGLKVGTAIDGTRRLLTVKQ